MARHISEGLSHRNGRRSGKPKASERPQQSTSSLGDLTPEEQAVIRKMRQKHQSVDYTADPSTDLKILDSSRLVSNNIFSVTFQGTVGRVPLEAFMTDSDGKTISNVKTFTPDGTAQKVTLLLQAGSGGYDPKAAYYLIVRRQNAGTCAEIKEQYTINISFASDFDF